MERRLLIITDSLGLPRSKPAPVAYENTWPCLLRSLHDFTIHQLSIGGATTSTIADQLNYYGQVNPDVVVVQLGIVDCAPRALGYHETMFIGRFRTLRRVVNFFLNKLRLKYFLRRFRKLTYVSRSKFEKNVRSISLAYPTAEKYWVGIVPAMDGYEKELPGITENIKRYNQILAGNNNFTYLSLDNIPAEGVMPDFHHLTTVGHLYVFNIISERLNHLKSKH